MRSNSYSLDARVVVQHRGQPDAFEGPFALALLVSPPTPEGTHAIELGAPGYARCPIAFSPPMGHGQRARRSDKRVSFIGIGGDSGDAKHAAIYRGDEIVAYGIPIPAPGHVAAGEIAFEPGSVRVKF